MKIILSALTSWIANYYTNLKRSFVLCCYMFVVLVTKLYLQTCKLVPQRPGSNNKYIHLLLLFFNKIIFNFVYKPKRPIRLPNIQS